MTSITEKEEKLLDANKTIQITRGNREFIIEPTNIICYGEIDYSNSSEDLDFIAQLDWYKTNSFCGFIMPSEYNYEDHTVTADIKGGRRFDTTQCDLVAQYAHGCIGKPKRTVIFKNDATHRNFVKRTR